MKKSALRGSLLLLLTSLIWGFAFTAQRAGMDAMRPVSFNGLRNVISGLCLTAFTAVTDRRGSAGRPAQSPENKRALLIGGICCGVMLAAASTLQQMGLVYTSAGKGGFITALYVVLVPVTNWLLFHKKPGKWILLSILMAVGGLFLLCLPRGEGFSLNKGDLMVIGCAVCFTGQILCVDHFAALTDPVHLSRNQFLVCGALCMIAALLTEPISTEGIRAALIPMLYAGVLSGAVGYTLQMVGQRDVNPTLASMIMCLESVFAVLGGAVLLGERMTPREGFGCIVMFAAVILAQLSS
ncbi:MAG: DMT family transporter [Clostridia bacterium]|nr:DMT family transporter [Clostridia bacterium]